MNYLVKNQKFYPFTARGDFMISRLEFSDYMAWTAKQLPNTQFATDISEVRFAEDHFVITANGESVTSVIWLLVRERSQWCQNAQRISLAIIVSTPTK